MKKLQSNIENYLKGLGFTDPAKMSKFYIEFLKNEGTVDSMGLIDPHEIEHIRMLIEDCMIELREQIEEMAYVRAYDSIERSCARDLSMRLIDYIDIPKYLETTKDELAYIEAADEIIERRSLMIADTSGIRLSTFFK